MENVIELKNLNYKYPKSENKNLEDINLTIEKGKFTVVMGPTGAGKTTLSMCLNGLIPKLLEGSLSGSVEVAGENIGNYPVQTVSKYLGLVLQDAETQIFGRTVEEDTAFGPRNFSIPKNEIENRVKNALVRVRLDGYQDRNTDQLSGGEKQRLAIAGVLAMQPQILILDEPTSELDPLGRAEIYTAINDLKQEEELTIICIEHSSQEIIEIADQIIIIYDSKVVWQGEPDGLFRDADLLNKYGIKPLPVSKIGWSLYRNKVISKHEVPLNIDETELLVRKLLKNQPLRNLPAKKLFNGEVNSDVVVNVKNLSHRYSNGNLALNNVNLEIRKGEFIALIGQNGAGKTTLAKHFNGLLKPSAGNVLVCGKNTREYDVEELARYIGYVFQNPDHQIFSTTVEKELEFGLKNIGLSEGKIKQKVEEVLRFTGLLEYSDIHPFSMGKGQRQMIAVASILAIEPTILIVDEPTTGQDWLGIQKMMALIKELNQAGTTIIMITHDMDVVAEYASRTVVMKSGIILLDDKTEVVFSNADILKEAYIMPPQIPLLSNRLKDLNFNQIISEKNFINLFFDNINRDGGIRNVY